LISSGTLAHAIEPCINVRAGKMGIACVQVDADRG
jgi:hypothetical protein